MVSSLKLHPEKHVKLKKLVEILAKLKKRLHKISFKRMELHSTYRLCKNKINLVAKI